MKKLFLLSIPVLTLFSLFFFGKCFADEPLPQAQVNHNFVFVTNDGKYRITSDNLELIPRKFKKSDTLFSVYKNGELYENVSFEKVIANKKNLKETASHYFWGTIKAVNDDSILLQTAEGKKIYDFETKEISQVQTVNEIFIVKDELNILTKEKVAEYLNDLFDFMFSKDCPDCREIIKQWNQYDVQLESIRLEDKERIFFNFLTGITGDWLETDIIEVDDGGNYFWQIYYDVKEKEFFNLGINGLA